MVLRQSLTNLVKATPMRWGHPVPGRVSSFGTMCGELLQFCPISNVDFLSFPFKSQFRSGAIGMDSHLVYQREREREEKELVIAFPVAALPARGDACSSSNDSFRD